MRQTNIGRPSSRTHPLSRQVDLNLLELFDSVYRTRNLTASGVALGLSQPAVSRPRPSRTLYDDAFSFAISGVHPTVFADRLAESLAAALAIVRDGGEAHLERRPRGGRSSTSDIGERHFLPASAAT